MSSGNVSVTNKGLSDWRHYTKRSGVEWAGCNYGSKQIAYKDANTTAAWTALTLVRNVRSISSVQTEHFIQE